MKALLFLLSALALVLPSRAQDTTEAMLNYAATSPSNGSPLYSPIYSEINGPIGWTFQPTVNIEVTALGAFAYLFPHAALEIGLWDASGDLLASQTVTSASAVTGQSLYQTISPVSLTANDTYYLAAFSSSGVLSPVTVTPGSPPNGYATMSPDIQLGQVAYRANSGFSFPSTLDGNPGDAIIAPNFEFQPIPEPVTWSLLGTGLGGWAMMRRKGANRCAA